MLEHLLTVSDQMSGKQHWVWCIALTYKVEQSLLAFDLRKFAEVTIAPQQVEGIIDQPVLSARCQFCLQFREVGAPLVNYDYLAIDDGLSGNVESGSDS